MGTNKGRNGTKNTVSKNSSTAAAKGNSASASDIPNNSQAIDLSPLKLQQEWSVLQQGHHKKLQQLSKRNHSEYKNEGADVQFAAAVAAFSAAQDLSANGQTMATLLNSYREALRQVNFSLLSETLLPKLNREHAVATHD